MIPTDDPIEAPGTAALPGQGEGVEARLLLISCITVVVTWIVIGFRPGYAMMVLDGLDRLLPTYSILTAIGGDWTAMVYRPEFFGGNNVLGTWGQLPVSILLAKFGVPALWNLNLSIVFIQSCMAYLGVAGVFAMAGHRPQRLDARTIVLAVGITWLLAFAPVMAWRIQAGHVNLIVAIASVQAVTTLWICQLKQARTMLVTALGVITLVHGLCVQEFQVVFYAMVFCLPLVIGAHIDLSQKPRTRTTLAAMTFVGICALVSVCLAAPILTEMVTYALGADAPRKLAGPAVTYGYITSVPRDWLSAMTWFDLGIAPRTHKVIHEIDYGLGPTLLIAAFFMARKRWAPVIGLAASLLLCFVFSDNVKPFSDWLIAAFPFLGDFRVPARAVIPVIVMWNMLAIGALLPAFTTPSSSRWQVSAAQVVIGVIAAGIVAMLPASGREASLWVLASVALVLIYRRHLPLAVTLSTAIAILCVAQFGHKISFAKDAARNLEQNAKLGRIVHSQQPDLASPFYRADIDIFDMGLYTSAVGGITVINGYGFPSREFAETLAHLGGWQYDSTRMHFNVSQGTRGFTPLQQLYNIHDHLALSDTGVPQLTPLPPTPGPVWASHQREQQADIARLGQSITRAVASPDWTATQLVGQPTASKTFDARCSNLGFSKPGVSDNARFYAIDLSASVDAPCPVTVSMSYSTSLWVFARTDGESMQVATYPAYGLLEGFEIPPGTRSILIIAQLSHGLAAMAFAGLGALLFMILLLWHSRRPTGQ